MINNTRITYISRSEKDMLYCATAPFTEHGIAIYVEEVEIRRIWLGTTDFYRDLCELFARAVEMRKALLHIDTTIDRELASEGVFISSDAGDCLLEIQAIIQAALYVEN